MFTCNDNDNPTECDVNPIWTDPRDGVTKTCGIFGPLKFTMEKIDNLTWKRRNWLGPVDLWFSDYTVKIVVDSNGLKTKYWNDYLKAAPAQLVTLPAAEKP